ncbi:MAG: MFS transporter [Treponema sp.]|jgi:probable glucitol transport protein GutA|nr:MFS transporter [Treponema sp.]
MKVPYILNCGKFHWIAQNPAYSPTFPILFSASISKERITFALFMVGHTMYNNFIGTYVQVFFTGMGIAAMTVALIFLVARIWDAVNDPIFGAIIDRSRLKGGKFLPWLRLAAFLIPLALLLIFAMPAGLPSGAKAAWAATAYILYGMSYTICDVPIFSMTSAITDQVQERADIMSRNLLAGGFATIAVMVGAPQLYIRIGWFLTALCVALPAAAFMFLFTRYGKERFINRNPEPVTLRSMTGYVHTNKYLLIFFSGFMLINATATTQMMAAYFTAFCLGDPGLTSAIVGCIVLPALIVAAFLPVLTRRFDKFRIFFFASVANALVGTVHFFAGYGNRALLFGLLMARGIFWGASMMTQYMFTGDLVEYGEFKTGKRLQGTAFSLQTLTSKLSGSLAGSLAMFILGLAGFVEGENAIQGENTVRIIWALFSLFPAAGVAIALPVLLRYRLRDQDVQIMARYNSGEIKREEAEAAFSHPY